MRAKRQAKDGSGKGLRLRAYVVMGLFAAFFSLIFARAFELQVMDGPGLRKRANSQYKRTITVQSKRGDIYDRNLKELAVSIKVDSIYAQPARVESAARAAHVLAPILSVDRPELERKLRSSRGFVWLKRLVDLSEDERQKVLDLEGVGIVKESKRYYPNRDLAANIIGFTGLDSNGLEGLELYYDNVLKGTTREINGERDARGRTLLYEDVDKKVRLEGMVVALTIDKTIQYITEKALKKVVEDSGAKGAVAVVMDPFTGEILSMAVNPAFDPNRYGSYDSSRFRNRVVTDLFEPGSVFKMFLMSSALEEGVVKPNDLVFCENGKYRVADRVFHDTSRHGWLSIPQIIKYSSNIGSAKVGERVGKDRLYRYLRAFGFGSETGVDLPGETSGGLRHPSKWSAVTVDTVSFGQGVSTTAIQLVDALSAIANGGFLMKPYIVKSVKDPDGKVISESNPVVVRRVISAETAARVTDMLIGVTKPGGTGVKAALDDFEVAGKTATAQKPDLKNGGYEDAYMSSFLGFVPANAPRLAILVAVDDPQESYHGGEVAAPAFREIAQQGLAYMGVFPERNGSQGLRLVKAGGLSLPVFEKVANGAPLAASVVPDFTGKSIRQVLNAARLRSIDVEIVGSGKAAEQKPEPGRRIPAEGPVRVWFR